MSKGQVTCSECGMAPWDRHCCSCEPCVQKRIERAVRTARKPAETGGEWRAPAEYVLQTPRGLLAYLDDCAGTTAKELIVEITAALSVERDRAARAVLDALLNLRGPGTNHQALDHVFARLQDKYGAPATMAESILAATLRGEDE